MKISIILFPTLAVCMAIAAAVALAGCNAANNPTLAGNIDQAIAIGCPIVSTLQASAIRANPTQRAALKTLALACPPNPPPTSGAVALVDLIAAIETLQPLLGN